MIVRAICARCGKKYSTTCNAVLCKVCERQVTNIILNGEWVIVGLAVMTVVGMLLVLASW